MLGQQTFCFQKFVDNTHQCFSFTPQANFPPLIWIFTEDEGDGIESRLSFKIFSTLLIFLLGQEFYAPSVDRRKLTRGIQMCRLHQNLWFRHKVHIDTFDLCLDLISLKFGKHFLRLKSWNCMHQVSYLFQFFSYKAWSKESRSIDCNIIGYFPNFLAPYMM